MAYQSLNPATGTLLMSFSDLTDAELETKLAAAEACYRAWRLTSYAERAAILQRASVLLHEQAETFAHTMTLEMGKKIGEARGEVEFSASILAYYAKNAERFLAPETLHPTLGEAHMESSHSSRWCGVQECRVRRGSDRSGSRRGRVARGGAAGCRGVRRDEAGCDPGVGIYADKSRQIYVVKRGQDKGFAGVENTLFYEDNGAMVYGDAQAVLIKMIEAVRGLGLAVAA